MTSLPRNWKRCFYFAAYIVIEPGDTDLKAKQILSESEYRETIEKFGPNSFRVGMGAEAIKEFLMSIKLDELSEELKHELENASVGQKRVRIIKRLEVVEAFRKSGISPNG